MEHMISTHQNLQSPQRDLFSSIKQEFGKAFHDTKLDILANPSEIGFVDIAAFATQSSSTAQEGTHRFSDPEIGLIKSDPQLEFISNKDVPALGGFSPFKTINYREDDIQSLQFEPESPNLYSDKLEPKSKESYFYPQHLSLEQVHFADFPDNQNYFDDCEDEPLGLILSDPKKTQTTMPRSLKLNFDDSESENEDSNHLRDYKIKNSPYSKIEDDLGKLFNKRSPSNKSDCSSMFIGHYESTLDTQQVFSQNDAMLLRSNPSDPSALMQGKFEAYPGYFDFEDPYLDIKGRSSRGLRALSLRVKDVVAMKEKTSYKEVADFLTAEVAQRLKADGQGESRDEQNVKRRVYDALNVLIAADILNKEGKVVTCGENVDNIGVFKKRRLLFDLDRIKRKTMVVQKRMRNKQKNVQEMMFKVLAIQNLMKRNKETHKLLSHEEFIKADQKKNKEGKQNQVQKINVDVDKTIRFPFIMVPSVAPSTMNLHINKSKRNAMVESKCPLDIFGDTDVLLKLKFHYVSKDLFDKVIDKDLHKYVPQAYLEKLV